MKDANSIILQGLPFDVDYSLKATECFHIFENIRELFNLSVPTVALIYKLAAML